jgi:hypothetical protein
MKTENYPSWLVPIEIAKSLKEIGFNKSTQNTTSSDILESKRYKEENKIYSQNYILKESSYNANSTEGGISIPTWEQVFEWFRSKNILGLVECQCNPEIEYFTRIIIDGVNYYMKGERKSYKSYEECRKVLVEKLIEIYETNINI